jgi:hypothetical protein
VQLIVEATGRSFIQSLIFASRNAWIDPYYLAVCGSCGDVACLCSGLEIQLLHIVFYESVLSILEWFKGT